jgi:hypothetical protein
MQRWDAGDRGSVSPLWRVVFAHAHTSADAAAAANTAMISHLSYDLPLAIARRPLDTAAASAARASLAFGWQPPAEALVARAWHDADALVAADEATASRLLARIEADALKRIAIVIHGA